MPPPLSPDLVKFQLPSNKTVVQLKSCAHIDPSQSQLLLWLIDGGSCACMAVPTANARMTLLHREKLMILKRMRKLEVCINSSQKLDYFRVPLLYGIDVPSPFYI